MNAEEKKRYFTETALVLNREGFHAETIVGGTLGVWLDNEPLCEVSEVGGITYRTGNIATPERCWPERAVNMESSLSPGIGTTTEKACLTATISPEIMREQSRTLQRDPDSSRNSNSSRTSRRNVSEVFRNRSGMGCRTL